MGKDKTPIPREVAVAIPYCRSADTNNVEVCLVTSRKHDGKFVLPKGGVEMGETGWQAAVREMWEEAGLRSSLDATDAPALGSVEDHKAHKHATPTAFVARARYTAFAVPVQRGAELAEWPEQDERQRRWFTYQDACDAIAWRKDIHHLLCSAKEYLHDAA